MKFNFVEYQEKKKINYIFDFIYGISKDFNIIFKKEKIYLNKMIDSDNSVIRELVSYLNNLHSVVFNTNLSRRDKILIPYKNYLKFSEYKKYQFLLLELKTNEDVLKEIKDFLRKQHISYNNLPELKVYYYNQFRDEKFLESFLEESFKKKIFLSDVEYKNDYFILNYDRINYKNKELFIDSSISSITEKKSGKNSKEMNKSDFASKLYFERIPLIKKISHSN